MILRQIKPRYTADICGYQKRLHADSIYYHCSAFSKCSKSMMNLRNCQYIDSRFLVPLINSVFADRYRFFFAHNVNGCHFLSGDGTNCFFFRLRQVKLVFLRLRRRKLAFYGGIAVCRLFFVLDP